MSALAAPFPDLADGAATSRSHVAVDPRLCAINGRFLGAPATGVQRVAREISHAFARMAARRDPAVGGLRFEIWVPPGLADAAQMFGLPVRVVGSGGGNLWEQLSLPFFAPDATLLNLCNMGPVLRRKCVTMIHDAQVFRSPASYSPAFRIWYQVAQRRLARRHSAILTVSSFSARELATLGVTQRDAIPIHNGADHVLREIADPGVLDRLSLARRGYVLALASTMPHKNIAVLLRAFADPGLAANRLVLYGSANADTFAQAGLSVPDNVVFAGRVSEGELRGLLENALCLAFPSLTEGFGLPPLEAMQLGCPAIVSPNGALREVCGEAALYADADDPADWIGAILALSGDAVFWEKVAQAGRDHARRFTWDRAAAAIAQVVRDRDNDRTG